MAMSLNDVLMVSEQKREVPASRNWLYFMPVSKRKYIEQIKEEFWEGRDISGKPCVLRRWRDSTSEIFQHEVRPGYLEIELARFVAPIKNIRSLLKRESFLNEEEKEWFVAAIRSAVALNRATLEKHFKEGRGEFWESDHPLVAFFIPDDDGDVFESIMHTAEGMFPAKKKEIKEFIERNREDIMTVKVVRKFTIHGCKK